MKTSITGPIAVVLFSFLILAACKEPNQAERPTAPTAADPAGGATASADKAGEPEYLAGKFCNVESIDGQTLGAEPFRLGAPSNVRGWLADGEGRVPEQPMLVLTDENKNVANRYPLTVALNRPDVAKAFPDQRIPERSGFELRLDPAGLSPKSYSLYLVYRAGGQWYACDNGRVVNVP